MPTGYTCFIEDGEITTAKEFIMLCARAFGACISMRDEPLSKPIPEKFEADTHYQKWLDNAKRDLEKYRAMTMEEVHAQVEEEYQKRIKERKKAEERDKRIYDAYLSVLDGVKRWNPPTPEHQGVKDFAIEQIKMCMDDMDGVRKYRSEPIRKPTDSEWIMSKIESCINNIRRYEESAAEERERNKSRNKWLKDLRDSLENLN